MASSSQAQKRARGSDSETESDEVPAQPHLHPFLSFAAGTPEAAKLARMATTPLLASRVIDWPMIQTMELEQRLTNIISPRWRVLFDVPRQQYVELTYEFFSSFVFRSGDLTVNTAVEFSLGGTLHHMSISHFATLMGLYTEAEISQPIFTESLRTVTTRAHSFSVMQQELVAWWPAIGDGVWRPSCPASWIRDPVIRYLHRAITCTITGRHLSIEKISELDLFVLYCLLRPAPANLAAILLTSLARNRGKSARICQGTYVTRIAERLGLFEHFDPATLTAGPPTVPIRVDDLIQMGIVVEGPPPRFLPVRDPVLPPAPAGAAAEHVQPIAQPPPRQIRTRPPPPTIIIEDAPPDQPDQPSLRALFETMQQEHAAQFAAIREEQAAQRALLEQILSRQPPQ